MIEQLDFLTYPHSCGYKVSGTSQIAAKANEAEAKPLRDRIYELLKANELTSDEVADRLHRSILAIRPRLSELKAQGKIIETGAHRKNLSGLPANVMKAI